MVRPIFAVILVLFLQGRPGYGPGDQEYGFIEAKQGGFLFYWLFYVQQQRVAPGSRPLVIWLAGGPGFSSTGFGNFGDIGPLDVNGNPRQNSWANHVNLLFIDSPVGAGFSYVTRAEAYTKNNAEIAEDLVAFTKKFYKQYPLFSQSPLYVFGESYGGKTAIEFAKQLDAAISSEALPIDFRGVVLGDPWISPIDSVETWGPYLLHTGFVDEQGATEIQKGAARVRDAVDSGSYEQAYELWKKLEDIISVLTNGICMYNILHRVPPTFGRKDETALERLYRNHGTRSAGTIQELMDGPVRLALNIPISISYYSWNQAVADKHAGDFMKPVVDVVTEVLNNTSLRVAVYSGQLDLIVDTPGTMRWVDGMSWSKHSSWLTAARRPLVVNGIVEGYYKTTGNLAFYWINRAGHNVLKDNPHTGLELLRLITKFDTV